MSYGQRDAFQVSIITAAAVLCFAGMTVGVLAYAAIRPNFISTTELESPMVLTSLLIMLGFAHSFARKQLKELKEGWEKKNSKPIVITIRNFMGFGILIWFITLGFFSGPLSYISHISLEKTDTVKTISVMNAIPGHGRCQNNATLQLGADGIWASRLCHISDSDTQQLRQGGKIRAYGVFTRYGMQITSFEVISAG
jgi:hypothetical protein